MEKSINSRYYFDYNATSPLSTKVIDFLRGGEFLFGNPASLHATGKTSKKFISETRTFLFKTFELSENDYELVFHSGATEGINTFFKGNALFDFKNKKKACFVFSKVDHQAIISLEDDLKALGHEVYYFDVDKNGRFDKENLIKKINSFNEIFSQVYLNFTVINNETGIVWSLQLLSEIKNQTKAIIHIDAVQLVGKNKNWNKLNSNLDAYVFSAHKFGALKGIGFSFYKKNSPYYPLITGGNQQVGMRSGTENALGIYSIKLALQEIIEKYNFDEANNSKLEIEKIVKNILQDKGEIVGGHNPDRNSNTIFFVIFGAKAELVSMRFDMSGIDVSTGSACSSGVIKENRVLLNMGYSSEDSRSCIRLSFSPFLNSSQVEEYSQKIVAVIKQFI